MITNNIHKYGCDFTIERWEDGETFITGVSDYATVVYKVERHEDADGVYYVGKVESYDIRCDIDRDIFLCDLCGDLYDIDDESEEWVIENCLHEYSNNMEHLADQAAYRNNPDRF